LDAVIVWSARVAGVASCVRRRLAR